MIKANKVEKGIVFLFYNSVSKKDIEQLTTMIKQHLNKSDDWIEGFLHDKVFKINRGETNNIYSLSYEGKSLIKEQRIESYIDPLKKMKYGKYKGKTISYVFNIDRDYFDWWKTNELKTKQKTK